MAIDRAPDIDFMLEDAGIPVSVGGIATQALRADPDSGSVPAGTTAFAGRELVLTIRSGTLPGLAEGNTIVVEGVSHRITSVLQQGRGVLTHVTCART